MRNIPIIDAHVHCDAPGSIREGMECLFRAGVQRVGTVSYGHMESGSSTKGKGNSNPAVLAAKSLYPARVYALGGINHYPALRLSEKDFARDLIAQAERMYEMGFDGVKLIESKPSFYVKYPYHMGHEVFGKFFETLEELGMPVLWHVADPETFWDPKQAPESVKEAGWYYGDGDFPTREELYRESLEVIERHPDLQVIFAHFFFLSADLKRLGELMDRHSGISVDITPGGEMFYDFSQDVELAREFFGTYQDRILFGSDTILRCAMLDEDATTRDIAQIRACLETDVVVPWGEDNEVKGLHLEEDVLAKIYGENFLQLFGNSPRSLDTEKALEECDRIAALCSEGELRNGIPNLAVEARGIITTRR